MQCVTWGMQSSTGERVTQRAEVCILPCVQPVLLHQNMEELNPLAPLAADNLDYSEVVSFNTVVGI